MKTEEEIQQRIAEARQSLAELMPKINKPENKDMILSYLLEKQRLDTRIEMLEWFLGSQCYAKIWHGPGHQTDTNCRVEGPHEIHRASYHGPYNNFGEASWRGDEAHSGYFDEPPQIEEP